jgi:AAA domain/CHC2 zinc finger
VSFVSEHLIGRPELVRQVFEWSGVTFNGRSRGHEWRVTCPFHSDEHPSLDINDEKAMYVCRACGARGDAVKFYMLQKGLPDAAAAIKELSQALGISGNVPGPATRRAQSRRVVATTRWEIRDCAGELIRFHDRLDFDDGKKSYPWYHPDGRKSEKGETQPETLPLYGSERVATWTTSKPVYICEGEKSADAMLERGYQALGTVTGANSTPSAAVLEIVRDFEVVLWPDADPDGGGRQHMERIAAFAYGVAHTVDILTWPDAPPKGDAHDFFASGGTGEQLEHMTAISKRWKPEPRPSASPLRSFTLEQLRARPKKARELVVAPFMGRAESTFFYGPKGHGKTWAALGAAIVGAAGNGAQFLNFRADGPGVPTLYIDAEMFEHDITQRAEDICRTGNLDPGDNLRIWTPDAQPDGTPLLNLLTEEGRQMLEDHIEDISNETGKVIGEIYFDNLATLLHGWVEKDSDSWNPVLQWTLSLRARQIGNNWVHHSNRAGGYRGSSAIVTTMHAIIRIAHPPEGYRADMGACFDLTYEYTRAKPESGLFDINARLEGDVWTVKEAEPDHDELIRILFEQGLSVRAIADQIDGTSKSSVERAVKRLGLKRTP